jgi:hypothetical protein
MPPIDYTTVTDVFAYGDVRSPNLIETAVMADVITAVSRKVDKTCVQQFSYTTYTNVIYTPRIDVAGTLILYLPAPTIAALTTITLRAGNVPITQPINFAGTGVQYDTIDNGFGSKALIYGFAMNPYREMIMRAYVTWAGGWANLAAVPFDFQFAVTRWSWWEYKRREAALTTTATPEFGQISVQGAVPGEVTDVLNRYTWFYR